MRRIRIGNDFQVRWAIEREGIPEPLDAATDIKILVELNYLCSSNQRVNKPLTAFTVSGNYVFMDFTAEFCSQYGDYRIIMQYTIPDSGMIDGDRKIVTDITPFTIVGASEDADSSADFFVDTDIVTGFKGDDGLSSFEVWLLDNPTGTIDEYWDFIKMPNEGFLEGLVDYLDDPTNNIRGISTPELSSATGTITIAAGTTVKGNVDTRNSTFYADSIRLNTSATPTFAPGEIGWEAVEKVPSFGLEDGGRGQINKEIFDYYTNVDTVPLIEGDVVCIRQIAGNRKAVKRLNPADRTDAFSVVGVVTVPTIAVNAVGRVTKIGHVTPYNTSGWSDNDPLWVSSAAIGKLTNVQPDAGVYSVKVGHVVVSSVAGTIDVRIQLIPKLSDLSDVDGVPLTTEGQFYVLQSDGTWSANKNINDYYTKTEADNLLNDKVDASLVGAANGLATLGADGLVPPTQLPSFVDDVLEFADLAAFPATGETGKIYVALDTNKTYRWSGSAYIYITSGAVDSVAGKTGVVTLVKADVGLSNVDNTSDANKPISTAAQTALNGKVNNTGNETIGGVKTFTSSPVVPDTPATDQSAVNKQFVVGTATSAITKAQQWAENPEDVEVITGEYSAKHWAAKAGDAYTELPNAEHALADIIAHLEGRIKALEKLLVASQYNTIQVKELSVVENVKLKGADLFLFGTAAPAVTPDFIGQFFIDTVAGVTYQAKGITNAADWKATSNA